MVWILRPPGVSSACANSVRARRIAALSGGASQLTGLAELGSQILGRSVRVARPLGFGRLPVEAKSASFAVPSGLLVYPQFAHLEHVEPRHTRQLKTGTDGGGYFGKVGRWLREGF
jgi:cell division protein FtsA